MTSSVGFLMGCVTPLSIEVLSFGLIVLEMILKWIADAVLGAVKSPMYAPYQRETNLILHIDDSTMVTKADLKILSSSCYFLWGFNEEMWQLVYFIPRTSIVRI